jgi:hypothetical protein
VICHDESIMRDFSATFFMKFLKFLRFSILCCVEISLEHLPFVFLVEKCRRRRDFKIVILIMKKVFVMDFFSKLLF